jgi:chaperonin cofactor prefoldin
MNGDYGLLAAKQEAGLAQTPRQMTPRERLEQKKRYLEAELGNVNRALDALTAHPDIEKVFELVGLAL